MEKREIAGIIRTSELTQPFHCCVRSDETSVLDQMACYSWMAGTTVVFCHCCQLRDRFDPIFFEAHHQAEDSSSEVEVAIC